MSSSVGSYTENLGTCKCAPLSPGVVSDIS